MKKWLYLVCFFILVVFSLLGLFAAAYHDTRYFTVFMDNFVTVLLELFEDAIIISVVGLAVSLIANLIARGKNELLKEVFEFFIASFIVFGVMRIFLNAIFDVMKLQ